MKIISWNCQGKFREKSHAIAKYKPDIAIIQECECPERLVAYPSFNEPHSMKWFGGYESKGLCVMSYTGYSFELHDMFNPTIQYCIPLRVKGENYFNLIAVWTQNHPDKNIRYVGYAYRAVGFYKSFIRSADTVLVGDFNSNQIWDCERNFGNHTHLVDMLSGMEIVSVYHEINGEMHGSESQPTFYMNRNIKKPYHIDHCFVPKGWVKRVKYFSVEQYHNWKQFSDHSPLIIEFDDFQQPRLIGINRLFDKGADL